MKTKDLRKEWCKLKGVNFIDFETLTQAEEYILFLEKRIEELTAPVNSEPAGTKIESLGLSIRALNVLSFHCITTLEELCELSIYDFIALSNVGHRTVQEVSAILEKNRLWWRS
jgi:DNA-directed RNA polymerase alpha subunit